MNRNSLIGIVFVLLAVCVHGCKQDHAVSREQLAKAHKLFSQKENAAALREYRAILADAPGHAGARLMVGKILYFQKKFTLAERELMKAHESNPQNLNVLFWLAKAQSVIPGRAQHAMRNVEEILVRDPGRIEAWHLKGLLQEARKDVKGAMASYSYALSQGRKLALVHMQLGLLYRKNKLPDAAEREFRIAEILSAGDPALRKQIRIARQVGIKQ